MSQHKLPLKVEEKELENLIELDDLRDPPKPFLKWVGGKRALLKQLDILLPQDIGIYAEPFVGGGAMFFHLQIGKLFEKATIADCNEELITTWKMVRDQPTDLLRELRRYKSNHCEEFYYRTRDKFKPRTPLSIAARMIYLNKTCFNGLYRVNSQNKFNVPMGRYENPSIVDEDNIRICSEILQGVDIQAASYDQVGIGEADFAYIDPPYDETFTNYIAGGFHQNSQEQLRDVVTEWATQGRRVMISNSDTKLIRSLYDADLWNISEVKAGRVINADPNGRGAVTELVIRNFE